MLLDTDSGLDLQIEWYTDLYFPFAKRWAERVRNITSEEKLVFLEPIPNEVREFFDLYHGSSTLVLIDATSSLQNRGRKSGAHLTWFLLPTGKLALLQDVFDDTYCHDMTMIGTT